MRQPRQPLSSGGGVVVAAVVAVDVAVDVQHAVVVVARRQY